jgi:ribosomal protein L2
LQGSLSDAQVYVAQGDKAFLKKIIVTNGDNNYLKVLSGLNEGEMVVTTGQVNLSDGKAIKIIK